MKKTLLSEFPKTSTKDWKKIIEKDLKGNDYYEKLVWKTDENIDFQPFYRLEDLKDISYISEKNSPYLNQNKKNNSWRISHEIYSSDIKEANKSAKKLIEDGVDSLIFNEKFIDSYKDLELLLSDINPEDIHLNFKISNEHTKLLTYFAKYIYENNYDNKKISGSFFYDHNKFLFLTGRHDQEKDVEYIKNNLESIRQASINYNIMAIHSYPFKSSGANIVQELAYTISSAIDSLINLSKNDVSLEEVINKLIFSFSISSNYFMEIAKLRAARLIWPQIIEQLTPEIKSIPGMKIHCHSADFNKTLFDPHVNLLRSTIETMASAIGGADSIQVVPFDRYSKTPDDFSDRIAKNIQLLTKHESFLDKVVDPAAGSYYIEKLTSSIANEALKLIIEIEDLGGFTSAFKNKYIQNSIAENKTKIEEKIEKRKQTILGTNQFPNTEEKVEYSYEEEKELDSNRNFEPLKLFRASEKFENLRLTNQKNASMRGENVKVFLLPLGNIAMRTTRANFSLNFFGCAGYEIIDNPGFEDIDEGINSALHSKAKILVICSSDKEYPELVPQIINKIKESNEEIKIVVAGYPKDSIDELAKLGVDDFIHIRSNALEVLSKYQEILN